MIIDMKKKVLPYIVILAVAIVASTLITTWSSISNISSCVHAPGCIDQNKQPHGELITRNYGFPSTYKQTVTFNPINNDEKASNYAGYTTASTETKSTSAINIVINIIFWLALLHTCYSFASRQKARR
jgi:hypothetical protein